MSAWFNVTNQTDNTADVEIFEEIGSFGVSAKEFANTVKGLEGKHLNLRINSPGGSIIDGQAIIAVLNRHAAGFTAWVEGLAASMASVIACAADRCYMAAGSMMMIHRASTLSMGDAATLRKDADLLEKFEQGLLNIYARKTGLSFEELGKMLEEETWMDAQEAVDLGFADKVVGATPAMASLTKEAMRAKFDSLLASMAKKTTPANEIPVEEPATVAVPAVEEPVTESAPEVPAEEPAPVETAEGTITPEVEAEPVALASDAIKAKFDALTARAEAAEARAELAEAKAAKVQAQLDKTASDLGNLERSLGVSAARITPEVSPVSDPVKSLAEQFAEIKDAAEKARFYRKHKAEILRGI